MVDELSTPTAKLDRIETIIKDPGLTLASILQKVEDVLREPNTPEGLPEQVLADFNPLSYAALHERIRDLERKLAHMTQERDKYERHSKKVLEYTNKYLSKIFDTVKPEGAYPIRAGGDE